LEHTLAYRYGDRHQTTLLPDSIDGYVSADDPVHAYDAFIDSIDVDNLGLKLDDSLVGNSTYDPITMLKILVYSYSYGWRSSRKIERALYHNLSFIWLAGGMKPDHKTISRFRKEHKEVLKNLLGQCARLCYKLGLIDGNTLFVDGSKFRANASANKTHSKQGWQKISETVDKRIAELLEECEAIDDQESGSFVKMNKQLQSQQGLKTKIGRLLEEFKDEDKINSSDPDSRIMRGRQGSHSSFNSQIVVDDQHGLIVHSDVNSEANDLNQMYGQISQAEATLDKRCETACADGGYSSVDDLKKLADTGRTVVVPTAGTVVKERDNPFGKHAFQYNETNDTYTCPAGKDLYRSYAKKGTNKIVYRMQDASACRLCRNYGLCTNAKRGRTIVRLNNEQTKDKLNAIYNSEAGQTIYARRKLKAELPFGHMKRTLGAGQFLLRGIDGVKAELSLLSCSFNIRRVLTLLGGVPATVQQLRGS
jgi:transposase